MRVQSCIRAYAAFSYTDVSYWLVGYGLVLWFRSGKFVKVNHLQSHYLSCCGIPLIRSLKMDTNYGLVVQCLLSVFMYWWNLFLTKYYFGATSKGNLPGYRQGHVTPLCKYIRPRLKPLVSSVRGVSVRTILAYTESFQKEATPKGTLPKMALSLLSPE